MKKSPWNKIAIKQTNERYSLFNVVIGCLNVRSIQCVGMFVGLLRYMGARAKELQRPGRPWPPHFLGQFFIFFQPAGN